MKLHSLGGLLSTILVTCDAVRSERRYCDYLALNLGLLLLAICGVPFVQSNLPLPGNEQEEMNLAAELT